MIQFDFEYYRPQSAQEAGKALSKPGAGWEKAGVFFRRNRTFDARTAECDPYKCRYRY